MNAQHYLLGVRTVDISNVTDLNDIKYNGITMCFFVGSTNPANTPIDPGNNKRFQLFEIRTNMTGTDYIQFFIQRGTNVLYMRSCFDDWTSWKEL